MVHCFEMLSRTLSRAIALRPAESAVYVGDGPWDFDVANRLGVGFIGIDCEGCGRLGVLDVKHVLPDFSDFDRFMAAIEDLRGKRANYGGADR